jgi:hypothetical protein
VYVTFPGMSPFVLTLQVPVPLLPSVMTQTTLLPDLTVTVPVGCTPAGVLPLVVPLGVGTADDEQETAPSAAPNRTTLTTSGRTRMDHHHCEQNGREVRQ